MSVLSKRRMDRGLTKREEEIFDLYCLGKTRRETAKLLWLSPSSVSRHLYVINQKLERELSL